MLDYTIPQFQFSIGSFDASQYLDSISLSVPMYELNQPLLWTGRFTVSNNLAARIAGLGDADFSERANPFRWRPYQQQVRLNIRGYQSPVFRIENYRYDSIKRTGEGTLTQLPAAVAGDRPAEFIPTQPIGGAIGSVIQALLSECFRKSTVNAARSIAGDGGVLDVPISSRDPWGDAVRLSSLSWHWLGVDINEVIYSVNPSNNAIIFTRISEDAEVVPDLDAIYQDAYKVIVTGARQVEDIEEPDKVVPQSPRPKVKTTTENRPIGAIFPSLAPNDTPAVFEQKTIIYQYWDDESWLSYLPFGVFLTQFIFDISSITQSGINVFGQPPADLNVPLQTITLKLQPRGFLFPKEGVDSSLIVAEVLVESNLRKLTIKPRGVLFASVGSDATLIIEKRETLTSALIPPGAQLTSPNQQNSAYEPRPKLEPPQLLATRPLRTEVLKGEAMIAPIGWTPVFPTKPLVIDFGFLPNAGRADFLARRIAAREQYRRDQVLVDMPIPSEWLALGWPLLSQCRIGNDLLLMDGIALSISDGVAKFGFTGARVGSYPANSSIVTPIFNAIATAALPVRARISAVVSISVPLPVSIGFKPKIAATITIFTDGGGGGGSPD